MLSRHQSGRQRHCYGRNGLKEMKDDESKRSNRKFDLMLLYLIFSTMLSQLRQIKEFAKYRLHISQIGFYYLLYIAIESIACSKLLRFYPKINSNTLIVGLFEFATKRLYINGILIWITHTDCPRRTYSYYPVCIPSGQPCNMSPRLADLDTIATAINIINDLWEQLCSLVEQAYSSYQT